MELINRRQSDHTTEENAFKDILLTLKRYKKSILFIILLTFLLTTYFIYFKQNLYRSTALIEVTTTENTSVPGDFLGSAFSDMGSEKVDKEMEIIKTFYTNNMAIDRIDFHTRQFIDSGFKKLELYKNVPIEIINLKIFDDKITTKQIKIDIKENGFYMSINQSIKTSILNMLFNKETITLNNNTLYKFDEEIKNKYFQGTIKKKNDLHKTIYLNLNTDNRSMYNLITQNLTVAQINPQAPIIKISYDDTIPMRADDYANALIDSFISQSIAEKSTKNDRIIDFINKELIKIKIKLTESEEKLEHYRIKYKAIDPTLQAQNYITELSNVEIQLSQNKLNKILIDNLMSNIKKNQDIDSMAPLLMQLDDKSTLDLITKLQDFQIQEQIIKSQFSSRHPDYLAIKKQIKLVKKKIKLSVKNLKVSVAQNDASLTKLKQAYENNLESLPTQERILLSLKRDHTVSSETYEYLLRKKSENEMIKVGVLSDYRIIDSAYNNGKPIGITPILKIFIGLILGLILGIAQVLIRNFVNDTIKAKEDITNLTNIPIYGTIPFLNQKEIKLEVLKDPKSPFAESYRSLRTNLQFSSKENACTTILISSTIMSEGKSTTSANLGAIFQMANYKSIIINMDLRKPTLHTYFNVQNNLGMSTYLSGKNTINEIIHTTIYPNLDIIPSGPIPPNPSELILSNKMDELIDSLKDIYDYIIIDSAPLGLVTDTMHLMQYTDINLIVVREGYSRKVFITDLNNLIRKHDLKQIGIVINSVDMDAGTYGYGYGYGYGYDES